MGLQSPYPCEGRFSVIRPPLQTQTSQRSDLPSTVMQDGLDGSCSGANNWGLRDAGARGTKSRDACPVTHGTAFDHSSEAYTSSMASRRHSQEVTEGTREVVGRW